MRAIQLFCLGLVSLIWESLAECPCPLSLQFNPKTNGTIEECQFDIALANTSQVVETVICAPQENQCKLDTQTREVLNKFSFRAIARGDFGEIRSERSADVKKDGKVQLHPRHSLQVEFDPQTKMAIKRCDFSVRCPGNVKALPTNSSGSKCVYSTTGIPEEWENCSLSFVANGHFGKIHSEEFLLMFQDQPNKIVVTLKTAAMRRVTLEFSPQTELILKKCLFHVQCSNPPHRQDHDETPDNNTCVKSIDIPESKDCFVHASARSNQSEIQSENTSFIIDDNFRIRLVPVESTSSPDLKEMAPSEEDTIQDLHVTWTTSQLEVHFRGPRNATHCALELKSPETRKIRTHWFKAHDGQCNHVVSLPEPGGECLVKVITSDRSNRHIKQQSDNCFLRGPNLGLRFDVPSRWFALLTLYLVAFYPSIFESIG